MMATNTYIIRKPDVNKEVIDRDEIENTSHRVKRTHTDRWTKEETDNFYKELKIWGQDFECIEHQMKKNYQSK
jgi:hypothetical protein